MNHKATTRVQKAFKLDHVPVEKVSTMVQRTTLGGLFIVLGVVGAAQWAWSVYWTVGLCVFGATMWSGQLVTSTLKALLTPIQAYRDVFRGGDAP